MAKKKVEKVIEKPSNPSAEAIEAAKAHRAQQVQKMMQLAKIYEETLEPKVVLLFRRLEEMIAQAQMPLTHINLVLDLLKKQCVNMADTAYVTKGAEKLMNVRGGTIG